MSNKTVVLSDDHNIVRHAIKSILQEKGNYTVVGECSTADETVEKVSVLKPDFLVLDLGLPGKSGLEVIYELKQLAINTKIVVLTMFEDEAKVRQVFSAGAMAYILKNSSPELFLSALSKVANGELFCSEKFSEILPELEEIAKAPDTATQSDQDPLEKLSKREREVFYLLADGKPNRVIAKQLFISPRTVETHRARVIKKLGFNSTADLIRYAIRNNLLTA